MMPASTDGVSGSRAASAMESVDAHIHLTDRWAAGGLENEWVAATVGLQPGQLPRPESAEGRKGGGLRIRNLTTPTPEGGEKRKRQHKRTWLQEWAS